MPRTNWRKEDKKARNKRLGNEFCKLIHHSLLDKDVKMTGAAQAKFLGMPESTFYRKMQQPETVTLENLWDWVEMANLSAVELGKALGCRR